jgi:hypothetical protein
MKDVAQERLLGAVEQAIQSESQPQSVVALLAPLERGEMSAALLSFCADGTGRAFREGVAGEAVPFLGALSLSDVGLEKRRVWESTWDSQRRQDAGDGVGAPPVPPKYDVKDFRDSNFFRLRGKLDVPTERFIGYPGCESDHDGQPVYGWAGWNHLQRAQALTALYQKRKTEEAWATDRLVPMLAGLLELIPWIKQWHNEASAEFGGLRLGDYFDSFLAEQCRELGLTFEELRAWRPESRGRGRRTAAGLAAEAGDERNAPRRAGRKGLDEARVVAKSSVGPSNDVPPTRQAARGSAKTASGTVANKMDGAAEAVKVNGSDRARKRGGRAA